MEGQLETAQESSRTKDSQIRSLEAQHESLAATIRDQDKDIKELRVQSTKDKTIMEDMASTKSLLEETSLHQ
jgi:hypothetical protein